MWLANLLPFLTITLREGTASFKFKRAVPSILAACALSCSLQPQFVWAGRLEAAGFMQSGMNSFRDGAYKQSVSYFNSAEKELPAYGDFLWQRGISQYYAEDYEGCAKQFRRDVANNPLDTEEAIWTMVCEAQLSGGVDAASANMIRLPGKDRRPIMGLIYDAFSIMKGAPVATLQSIADGDDTKDSRYFYANLYMSLLKEMQNESTAASRFASNAVNSFYGQGSSDYMTSVARAQLGRVR